MNGKKVIFYAGIFGMLGAAAVMAGVVEYPCFMLSREPVIDGIIEDTEWANIPEAGGFYILGKNEYALEKQTFFRAAWTMDAFYFSVRCEEPNTRKLIAREKDQGALWEEDSVEIFFVPEKGSSKYTQMIVNTAGKRWNGKSETEPGQPKNDLWDWQAKTQVGKDSWSMEMKLPLALLRGEAKAGECWQANVARNMVNEPVSEHHTAWSPVKKGFNDLPTFNQFQFMGAPPTLAAEIKKIERNLRREYCLSMRVPVQQTADKYAQYKSALEESCKLPRLRPDAEKLRETWDLVNKAANDENMEESQLRQAFKESRGLTARTKKMKIRLLMEQLFADVK